MKTEILKIKGSWEEVVDDCRATVSKPPLGHDPRASFKRRILIAEHSPIRDLSVRFRWTGIKYWIAMHWKTHHWESKVSTQRSDRTGTPRDKLPQDAPVNFTGEMNAQAAIDTMRKRLCHQASACTSDAVWRSSSVTAERRVDIPTSPNSFALSNTSRGRIIFPSRRRR